MSAFVFTLSSGYQTIRPLCALDLWCRTEKNHHRIHIVLHHFLKQKPPSHEWDLLLFSQGKPSRRCCSGGKEGGSVLGRPWQILPIGWSVFGSRAALECLPMFADTDG
ncbi:hypothetical protein QQF64_031278 [Cirrhinus molitorella]|uniref:Uncharacterized protein n=1 Tax=Cirrhinus molitorella TaxID=172907 RepID=A0ABR3MWH3_9TELE